MDEEERVEEVVESGRKLGIRMAQDIGVAFSLATLQAAVMVIIINYRPKKERRELLDVFTKNMHKLLASVETREERSSCEDR